MTAVEYIQMRAFARIDGLKLFALWLASFACYIGGLQNAALGMPALLLALLTPFLVVRQLKKFRDTALEGTIGFGRAWAYVLFTFFYAGVLFAVAQFFYFSYLDKGFFLSSIGQLLSDPEMVKQMKQMGLTDALNENLRQLSAMRPIDLSLNILTSNLLIGCFVGIPIAAICKRSPIERVNHP